VRKRVHTVVTKADREVLRVLAVLVLQWNSLDLFYFTVFSWYHGPLHTRLRCLSDLLSDTLPVLPLHLLRDLK
jgi:hypothetical protein